MPAAPDTLKTSLGSVDLVSPIVLAAGTCGYVDELAVALDLSRVGAVTTKSITPEPRTGNAPMRVLDVKAGMVNAVGLANMGIESFIRDKAAAVRDAATVVIGSIAGFSVEDYVQVATSFAELGTMPIIEMNVSCPNCEDGRLATATPDTLARHVRAVREVLPDQQLFVKLPPDTHGLVPLARAAIESGADGLTMVNTLEVLSIDVHTRRSVLGRARKGMSGPAIHPLAVRLINDVYRGVARDAGVPIIGLGGVLDWEDAAEMILAGATAVGVGTSLFVDPASPKRIQKGLRRWVRSQGCHSVTELVGAHEEG
ncbi:MAG: dihydroorotate dehydrogenase [Planctomycetota bacterium]|nr:dihydroorotate dehydrogenase [Planctomycetota bacterium]MEC9158693.1 dihydroorotate dehydrogenase [Planctomycetota bacterium]MEC9233886.1 dihydroorotate dehydrogenase [Planctomycetota bacterium]